MSYCIACEELVENCKCKHLETEGARITQKDQTPRYDLIPRRAMGIIAQEFPGHLGNKEKFEHVNLAISYLLTRKPTKETIAAAAINLLQALEKS